MTKAKSVESPNSPSEKLCFVVGPIGEAGSPERRLADWLLMGIFKPTLEADPFGYTVKRADDDASPGSISKAVIVDVFEADLVVADLTGFNPNVFYELGLRHAAQRPTIHVCAQRVRLPFDNIDQRTIFVDISDYADVEKARKSLAAAARHIAAADYVVSNPVTQARGLQALSESADPRDQQVADLTARLAVVEGNLRAMPEASPYWPRSVPSKSSVFPSSSLMARMERLAGDGSPARDRAAPGVLSHGERARARMLAANPEVESADRKLLAVASEAAQLDEVLFARVQWLLRQYDGP